MKPWQRPHVPYKNIDGIPFTYIKASNGRGFLYAGLEGGSHYFCSACNTDILRGMESSPCPTRTVRLSNDPRAVRMLKAMGKNLNIVKSVAFRAARMGMNKRGGELLKFPIEVLWAIHAREDDVRAAVRAYWEGEDVS